MAKPVVRRLLRAVGLLEMARSIKRGFHPAFMPAKPQLLMAVHRSLRWSAQRNLLEGSDYLEFGIYRGFTLWYAQVIARDFGIQDMRFFGFDSFAGLPPVRGIDRKGSFETGDFYCSRKDVETFLSEQKTDWSRTFLVEGWFEKTLTPQMRDRHALRRCSLCVIDCDLYESAHQVLKFIEPNIGDQTIVLFDDWFDFGNDPTKGEQKAFSEFLQRNPHIRPEPLTNPDYDGQGFILRI